MKLLNLIVHFYKTDAGTEPVRDWLRSLPHIERKIIKDGANRLVTWHAFGA